MISLLLSVLYVTCATIFYFVAFGCGCACWLPVARDRQSDHLIDILTRVALGMVIISMIVVVLGLINGLKAAIVGPLVMALALAGLIRLIQSGTAINFNLWKPIKAAWLELPIPLRPIALITAAWIILLIVHIIIGGLAPDVGQDSIWYHLSVPGQWVIRGDVAMFTHCMPSTYFLGGEALYAAILLFSDEIACSSVYALMSVVLILWFPLVAWRLGGPKTALITAAAVSTLWAAAAVRAPVGAGNDFYAALFLALAWWTLWRPLIDGSSPTFKEAAAAGALLGGAISVKIVTVGFGLPAIIIFGGYEALVRRNTRRAAILVGIAGGAAILVLTPWLIRGFVWSGNPIIHISQTVFPVHPEFQPVLRGYDLEPRFYPLTLQGLEIAFTDGVASKFRFTATSFDAMFLLIPLAMLAALLDRRRAWRLNGFVILACYAGFLILHGKNEVVRYFAVSYPLAAVALMLLMERVSRPWRAGSAAALILILLTASIYTYSKKQWIIGNFSTVNWPYRPVLTKIDRLQWASKSEFGHYYMLGSSLQDVLPDNAVVLASDLHGPYYLKRKTYWSDFSCGNILKDWWDDLEAPASYEVLLNHDVTHLLLSNSDKFDSRIADMVRLELIKPVVVKDMLSEWTLYEVVNREEKS